MKLPVFLRYCSVFIVALGCAGFVKAQNTPQAATAPPTLLVVGDSISAEYGLKRGTGWVALLSQRMADKSPSARVVNASISGETTAGGRSRLAALLRQHQPRWVIIELGANDALRGLALQATEDNLVAMTRSAQDSGAKVLLLGMQMPPNYGSQYTARFAKIFDTVARQRRVLLVPFLLKGIADDPNPTRWFQPDRIHPGEAAQALMLGTVWPSVQKMMR